MGETAWEAHAHNVRSGPKASVGAEGGPATPHQRQPPGDSTIRRSPHDEPASAGLPLHADAEPRHRQRLRGRWRGRLRRRWRSRGRRPGRRRKGRRRGLRVRGDHNLTGHVRVKRAEVAERPLRRKLQPERLFVADRPRVEAAGAARGDRVRSGVPVRPADRGARWDHDRCRGVCEVPDLDGYVAGLARLDRRRGRAAVTDHQPGGRNDGCESRQGGKCSHPRTYDRRLPSVSGAELGEICLSRTAGRNPAPRLDAEEGTSDSAPNLGS